MDRYQKVIKIVVPDKKCPHCGNDILISTNFTSPAVDWVLKPEDVQVAKDKLKARLENSSISKAELGMVVEWLESPETMFGPEEVDVIFEQLTKKQDDSADKDKTS